MLLSCSDTVMIHDIEITDPLCQNIPFKGKNKLSIFNHNYRIVATATKTGVINFHSINLDFISSIEDNDITGFPITSLAFNKDSSFLAYSSFSGILKIWELKASENRLNTKFDSNFVSSMSFDNEGNMLGMGTVNGDCLIMNMEMFAYTKFKQIGPAKVNSLKYSPFYSNYMGVGYDNGAVKIYDVNSNSQVCDFSFHDTNCTGIAFSPINKLFLSSVGQDGKINFYDIQAKKHLKFISTDSELTSISFHTDGCTIAVGTTSGKILIYDLRKSSALKSQLDGHVSAVNSVEFSKKALKINYINSSGLNRSSETSNSTVKLQNVDLKNGNNPNIIANASNNNLNNNPKSSNVSLNENQSVGGNKNFNIINELSNINLNFGKTSLTKLTTNEIQNMENIIKDKENQKLNNSLMSSNSLNMNQKNSSIKPINLNTISYSNVNNSSINLKEINNSNSTPKQTVMISQNQINKQKSQDIETTKNIQDPYFVSKEKNLGTHQNGSLLQNSQNNVTGNFNKTANNITNYESNFNTSNKDSRKPITYNNNGETINNSFSDLNKKNDNFTLGFQQNSKTKSILNNISDYTIKKKKEDYPLDNISQERLESKLQTFIKKTMEDEMIKMRQHFHEEISSLHFDLIRQFDIQNSEIIKNMKNLLNVNSHMSKEIEKLKKENKELKSKFF